MASWIDLYESYLTDVPGCTYKMATLALRTAAQAFCEKTRAWRVTLDPVITRANQTDYEFDLSSEQEIVRVLSAKLDGKDFPVVLDGRQVDRGLIVHDPFTFSIFPAPPAGQRLDIHVALEPSNTASTLDDLVVRKHITTIIAGAKSELLGKKNQPYSDPVGAIEQRSLFDAGVDHVIGQLATKFSSGQNRVRASFM
jgi:hypothetical protein